MKEYVFVAKIGRFEVRVNPSGAPEFFYNDQATYGENFPHFDLWAQAGEYLATKLVELQSVKQQLHEASAQLEQARRLSGYSHHDMDCMAFKVGGMCDCGYQHTVRRLMDLEEVTKP